MKKKLALLILSIFLLQGLAISAEDVYQGHAEFSNEYPEYDEKLYTGKKFIALKRKTSVNYLRYCHLYRISFLKGFFLACI